MYTCLVKKYQQYGNLRSSAGPGPPTEINVWVSQKKNDHSYV